VRSTRRRRCSNLDISFVSLFLTSVPNFPQPPPHLPCPQPWPIPLPSCPLVP
jgi:hypothetical protein